MNHTPEKSSRILLGQIGAAHGIRGDVMVRTFTDDPAAIADYGPLTDVSGGTAYEVRVVRITSKGVIAHIAGVDDRNAAERLNGTDLYIERGQLPATDEAEYYHADLIGLRAVTMAGAPFGEVVAVHNFGAGDILEIRRADADAHADARREDTRGERRPETELIPFSKAAVPEVDLANGVLIIDPPAMVGADDGEEPDDDPLSTSPDGPV